MHNEPQYPMQMDWEVEYESLPSAMIGELEDRIAQLEEENQRLRRVIRALRVHLAQTIQWWVRLSQELYRVIGGFLE
jgi:uncharacterized small protein (DUF1192 family)